MIEDRETLRRVLCGVASKQEADRVEQWISTLESKLQGLSTAHREVTEKLEAANADRIAQGLRLEELRKETDAELAEAAKAQHAMDNYARSLQANLDIMTRSRNESDQRLEDGRETSQFTHARAALDSIIKKSERYIAESNPGTPPDPRQQQRCGAGAGLGSPLSCNREAGHDGDHMEGLHCWPAVERREP